MLGKVPERNAMTSRAAGPRICLAASGGGHVRQLLDLAPAWSPHDHFFLTEDTAMGRSLPGRTYFVPHVALGQARLGAPLRMVGAALRNLIGSAKVMLSERPDMVITTGAGSVFFTLMWARLFGARVMVIESFARFDGLSVFTRLAGPLAHHKVVQSPILESQWPGAAVFDPLRVLDTPPPAKAPLLFVTVGATLPFDRLVQSVAELKREGLIADEVIIQRGPGAAPAGITSFETAPFEDMLAIMRRARVVVCHGGTGSLITALREGCHVVAMPRRHEDGEHYDDHQSEIAQAFRGRGLIQVAGTRDELRFALQSIDSRRPIVATTDPSDLVAHLKCIIATVGRRRGRPGRLASRTAPAE
jgi:UDP-N-acetylglucosamine transferase subunit ALG13